MFWFFLAVLVLVGGFIYYRKQKSVMTLNAEQAEMVVGLIDKEKQGLADKMLDMADKAAFNGATVSIESIVPITPDMKEELRKQLEDYKQSLIDTYGTGIPANTAHRLSMEMEGNDRMWSMYPGCFERHLQRRDGNPLFPPERRLILRKEIEEAVEKDRVEAQLFKIKHRAFVDSKLVVFTNKKNMKPTEASELLQEVMLLAEECAIYGESVHEEKEHLERTEEILMNCMNEVMPEGAEHLRTINALSCQKRKDYAAQYNRKDTSILKEELMATLLSEDLMYITGAGITCKGFELDSISPDDESRKRPDKLPNTNDIKTFIENAVYDGFSKSRADQIMAAWNDGLRYYEAGHN